MLSLLQMTELERENLLSQRRDEKQDIMDKLSLVALLAQQGGSKDSVSHAAKRRSYYTLRRVVAHRHM